MGEEMWDGLPGRLTRDGLGSPSYTYLSPLTN